MGYFAILFLKRSLKVAQMLKFCIFGRHI